MSDRECTSAAHPLTAAPAVAQIAIDGCLLIDVPGEGPQQLYNYVRSLLESSHDAYWPMIGQP